MQRRLDDLRIQNPCPKKWDQLEGDGVRRYCEVCDLHVTNLSGLTRGTAEDFLERAAGRTCVTWVPDAAGRPRTLDGPVERPGFLRVAAALAAALVPFLAACREQAPAPGALGKPVECVPSTTDPGESPCDPGALTIDDGDRILGEMIMGGIALPEPPSGDEGAR